MPESVLEYWRVGEMWMNYSLNTPVLQHSRYFYISNLLFTSKSAIMKTLFHLFSFLTVVMCATPSAAQWYFVDQPERPVAHYKTSRYDWVVVENYPNMLFSPNAGQTWLDVSAGLPAPHEMTVIAREAWLFGLDQYSGKIFRYDFNTPAWQEYGTGVPTAGFNLNFLEAGGNLLFIHRDQYFDNGKIYLSTDNGQTWSVSNEGLPENFKASFLIDAGGKVLVSGEGGLYFSADDGESWHPASNSPPGNCELQNLYGDGHGHIFTKDYCGNSLFSASAGMNWIPANGLPEDFTPFSIAATGGTIFMTGASEFPLQNATLFFASTNAGEKWEAVESLEAPPPARYGRVVVSGAHLLVTASNDLYLSADEGLTWAQVPGISTGELPYPEFYGNSHRLFLCGDGGFITSNDDGLNWDDRSAGIPLEAYDLQTLWAGDSLILASAWDNSNHGLLRSADYGATWSVSYDLGGITSFARGGGTIFATTWMGNMRALYKSTDEGLTWQAVTNSLEGAASLWSVLIRENYIYLGGKDGVYVSEDEGTTWELRSDGLTNGDAPVVSLAYDEVNEKIYAGTWMDGLYVSPKNGQQWEVVSPGIPAAALAADGGNVYAWSGEKVYYLHNGSNSWGTSTHLGMTQPDVAATSALLTHEGTVLVGAAGGVLQSTDFAESWENYSWGLPDNTDNTWLVTSLAKDGQYAYAVCGKEGIYRRSLLEFPTAAKDRDWAGGQVQIAPNPARGATILNFNLPEAKEPVYYRLVAPDGKVLMQEELAPGQSEQVILPLHGIPAGIYLVQLNSGHHQAIRRLMVLPQE
jgi:photosystem II stability/assembly factor-like uncharacterized protein